MVLDDRPKILVPHLHFILWRISVTIEPMWMIQESIFTPSPATLSPNGICSAPLLCNTCSTNYTTLHVSALTWSQKLSRVRSDWYLNALNGCLNLLQVSSFLYIQHGGSDVFCVCGCMEGEESFSWYICLWCHIFNLKNKINNNSKNKQT